MAKIAARTALVLQQYRPGRFEWVQTKQTTDTIEAVADLTDSILVIDGCPECCGMKKLNDMGLKADHHLIVADLLGIKKNMDEPKPEEVEKIIKAIDIS